jgi:hypothetical protein
MQNESDSRSVELSRPDSRLPWFILCTAMMIGWASLGAAQTPENHPWIAHAPGEFVRLIDKGNVKIQVDDALIRKTGKSALTIFRFAVDFDYKFRVESMESGARTGSWKFRIVSWMDEPKIRQEHTIFIPSSFQPLEPWRSQLLRHEFDHISISTDPRLAKIFQRVLQRRKNWIAVFEQKDAPNESQLRERVQEDIAQTVKNFESMIQLQYDFLDKISSEGMATIDSRSEFFQDLYTVAGLERCRFEYLATIKSFVADRLTTSASKQEVAQHYLFLNP